MAQFDFMGMQSDQWHWLEGIAELHRFTFVVNTVYSQPEAVQFRELTSTVWGYLGQYEYLYMYLRPDEYIDQDLAFGEPVHDIYRLEPRYSGPLLSLDLPMSQQKGVKELVGRGMLFFQPYLQDPISGVVYKPPQSLKTAFLEVKRVLRARLVKRYICSGISPRSQKREPLLLWISRDAVDAVEAGKAVIGTWEGGEIGAQGLASSREELKCGNDES